MAAIKESDIINLNFSKIVVSAEESGDKEFYYYTLDIGENLCLITSRNDSHPYDQWRVEIFNCELYTEDLESLKNLVNALDNMLII